MEINLELLIRRILFYQDLRNGTMYSGNILKMIIFTPYIAVLRKSCESQKANCKWRIAEVCDFQEKYLDFNRVNTTLTVEQETDVMSIVDEILSDD